jgi:hypothetical protein
MVATDNPFALPLTSFWMLNVILSGQGGTVNPPAGVYAVKVGDSTNVMATGNDWCRIQSLTTNGTPLVAAAGRKSYDAPIGPLDANGTNTVAVTFSELDSPLVAGVPNAWASNYYTEAQALKDPNLATDWLLGIHPLSGTNYIPGLAITAMAVTNTDLTLVLQLTTRRLHKHRSRRTVARPVLRQRRDANELPRRGEAEPLLQGADRQPFPLAPIQRELAPNGFETGGLTVQARAGSREGVLRGRARD